MKFTPLCLALLVSAVLSSCGGEKKEVKRASAYQERAFSIDAGPEYINAGQLDHMEVTLLKHRDTGRRWVIVRSGTRVTMDELR